MAAEPWARPPAASRSRVTAWPDLAIGLEVTAGGRLIGAQAVRSEDFTQAWFVAADIQGPGIEGHGQIGLWITNRLHKSVGFFAINPLAAEFSDWGRSPMFTASNGGARQAIACTRSALG